MIEKAPTWRGAPVTLGLSSANPATGGQGCTQWTSENRSDGLTSSRARASGRLPGRDTYDRRTVLDHDLGYLFLLHCWQGKTSFPSLKVTLMSNNL
jgi:hypothetical protein